MTQFASVVPIEMAPVLGTYPYFVAQAHLFEGCKDVDWKWFRNHQGIILDSGVIETGEPQVKQLYEVAKEIRPFEAVCPDAFQDRSKTLKLFHAHALDLSNYARGVMIVPQGTSVVDWVGCLWEMSNSEVWNQIPHKSIGIPKILDSFPGGRSAALAWMFEYGPMEGMAYFEEARVVVHLLGQWRYLSEVMRLISYFPTIRSWDSTWPYACAIHGKVASDEVPKYGLTPEDWHPENYIPGSAITLAEVNTAICQRATKMACAEGRSMGHG